MKSIGILLGLLFSGLFALAQVPQKIAFQFVAFDISGRPAQNQTIRLEVSLLQGDSTGTLFYAESHRLNSNANALVALEIGNGVPVYGYLDSVQWSLGPFIIRTKIDSIGSVADGSTQYFRLPSVPYALYAPGNLPTGSASGQILRWTGNQWQPINLGSNGQTLTLQGNQMQWKTLGFGAGQVSSLSCNAATHIGILHKGQQTNQVRTTIPYNGGNGGAYCGLTISSQGVEGLTAILTANEFTQGTGQLVFEIYGTPLQQGTATFNVRLGGQSCTFSRQVLPEPALVNSLDCNARSILNAVYQGQSQLGNRIKIPYNGGNGGTFPALSFSSIGVTGLVLSAAPGNISTGNDSLELSLTGIPAFAGTAVFNIQFAGRTCMLTLPVLSIASLYPPGSVFCSSGPSVVSEVVSPITGRIWMDRNLGATQVATSSTSTAAYGDLYQWGRLNDGHQCRNSSSTMGPSSSFTPGPHFITLLPGFTNWYSPANVALWQGVNGGVNNPCPIGFRPPTSTELLAETQGWGSNSNASAMQSFLKLPAAGYRNPSDGFVITTISRGYYWTSSGIVMIIQNNNSVQFISSATAPGYSVRCIKY